MNISKQHLQFLRPVKSVHTKSVFETLIKIAGFFFFFLFFPRLQSPEAVIYHLI